MQSTAYSISIQPLLFTSEDLSPCFFFRPTEDELRFMEMWENLVSAMPPSVRCDEGRSVTGRPGYTLLSVLAVHAVKKDNDCSKGQASFQQQSENNNRNG